MSRFTDAFIAYFVPLEDTMRSATQTLGNAVYPVALGVMATWVVVNTIGFATGNAPSQLIQALIPRAILMGIVASGPLILWDYILAPMISYAIGTAATFVGVSGLDTGTDVSVFLPIVSAYEHVLGPALKVGGDMLTAGWRHVGLIFAGLFMVVLLILMFAISVVRLAIGIVISMIAILLMLAFVPLSFFRASAPMFMQSVKFGLTGLVTIAISLFFFGLAFFPLNAVYDRYSQYGAARVPVAELQKFAWGEEYRLMLMTGMISLLTMFSITWIVNQITGGNFGDLGQTISQSARQIIRGGQQSAAAAGGTISAFARSRSARSQQEGAGSTNENDAEPVPSGRNRLREDIPALRSQYIAGSVPLNMTRRKFNEDTSERGASTTKTKEKDDDSKNS